MDIINVWIAILAFSVFMYVVLDGFDLGVGILFPLAANAQQKDQMIEAIAPVWDGNETWLIFTGVCLLAIFPKAYAALLSLLYIPVITMLLGLVFRGVAFEFREAGGHWKALWDSLFHLASVLVGFMQGMILGALIQGVNVQSQSAQTWHDWMTPFTLMTGISVVFGYALMGASWLIVKTDGLLQETAHKATRITLGITFGSLVLISAWTPWLNPTYFHKWFSGSLTGSTMMIVIPLICIIAALLILTGINRHRSYQPFLGSVILFASGYIGVLFNLYPNIVPPDMTFQSAAAPESSLTFLLPGTLVLLPIVTSYFIYLHWVFRGKVHPADQ